MCTEVGCDGEEIIVVNWQERGKADETVEFERWFCSWGCVTGFASRSWYGPKEPVLPMNAHSHTSPSPTMDLSLLMPDQVSVYQRAAERAMQARAAE